MTPLRVTVEISASDERVWRLSEAIDPRELRFEKAVPFDRGSRLKLRFELPGGAKIDADGSLIGEHTIALELQDPQREAVITYVRERR